MQEDASLFTSLLRWKNHRVMPDQAGIGKN